MKKEELIKVTRAMVTEHAIKHDLEEKRRLFKKVIGELSRISPEELGKREFSKMLSRVAYKYRLTYETTKNVFENWKFFGYVDGNAKDGHIKKISLYDTYTKYNYNADKNTVKVTPALIKKICSMKMNGFSPKEIFNVTGIERVTQNLCIKKAFKKDEKLGFPYVRDFATVNLYKRYLARLHDAKNNLKQAKASCDENAIRLAQKELDKIKKSKNTRTKTYSAMGKTRLTIQSSVFNKTLSSRRNKNK